MTSAETDHEKKEQSGRRGWPTRKKKKQTSPAELRKLAEARLAKRPRRPPGPLSATDALKLIHELDVHQIQLEIQNEELIASRLEVEAGLARYCELFDFAPIGYAVLDADGAITAVNHSGAQTLESHRGFLLGTLFESMVAVWDRPAFAAALLRARNNSGHATCEVELRLMPRTILHVTTALVARPIRALLLAFTDITVEREQTRQLAEAEAALRDQETRKDDFLAMLSHELRTPLTPIQTSLDLLERAPPESPLRRQAQAVMQRQVTHLTHLIDDLLDVTRITRGKLRLKRVRCDLAAHAQNMLDDHRAAFEARGIHLEKRFGPGPFWVDADPTRLQQVVGNLLTNAWKFTPSKGQVVVSLQRFGTGVQLRVSDSGAGIAREMLGHMFEPFSQAPQTLDRSTGGLGLGLASVKGLIELHGGNVAITSQGPGQGTEVAVWLPLVEAPAAAAPGPERLHGPRRVLVIDDNQDTAEGLQAVLTLRGHEVRIAHDGPTGIALTSIFHPEVVICDLGLPGLDGYSVAGILRREREDLYLVSLSGYASPEDVQRATNAGFDRHVAKPPDLNTLERLIAQGRH
jgi:two-component system CheB/CheR fusion protein